MRSRSHHPRHPGSVRLWELGRWLALLAALLSLSAASARADISGPDEAGSTAYGPLRGGQTYSGALRSSSDVDYLLFYIRSANTTIHVSVDNTASLASCGAAPDLAYCPIWVTLLDTSNNQVGGSDSSAGTDEVGWGESSSIDWTFSAPGKYFAYVQSDGEQPTYQLRIDPPNALAPSLPPSGPVPSAPPAANSAPHPIATAPPAPAAHKHKHRHHRRHRRHHRGHRRPHRRRR